MEPAQPSALDPRGHLSLNRRTTIDVKHPWPPSMMAIDPRSECRRSFVGALQVLRTLTVDGSTKSTIISHRAHVFGVAFLGAISNRDIPARVRNHISRSSSCASLKAMRTYRSVGPTLTGSQGRARA